MRRAGDRLPRVRGALAVVTLATLAACSAGTTVLGAAITTAPTTAATVAVTTAPPAPTTRPARTTAAPSSGTATPVATTAGRSPGSAAAPTPAPAAGTGTTVVRTDRCATVATDPRRDPTPTLAGGKVATSVSMPLRLPYPADWKVADVTVAADQIIDGTLLPILGLESSTPLRPLVVRAAAEYPGLAVFRFPQPSQDLSFISAIQRGFAGNRKFQMAPRPIAGCIDGEAALGLVGTNRQLFQAHWITYHGGSLYLFLGLGPDDGTAQTQNALAAEFSTILDSLRWTS